MDLKSKYFLILDTILDFFVSITYVLISFYIWEEFQSFRIFLEFNLYIFIALAVGSIIAGIVTSKISTKFVYLLGIVSIALLLNFLSDETLSIQEDLKLISIWIGSFYSLIQISRGVATQFIVKDFYSTKFTSYKQSLLSIVYVFTPFMVSHFINNIGYEYSFFYISRYFFLLAIFFIFIKIKTNYQQFIFFRMLKSTFQNKLLKNMAIYNIADGIPSAFFWGITNILILSIAGSISNWSYYSIGFALLGVIISFTLKSTNSSKNKGIISLSNLLFAISPIILIIDFDTGAIVVFTLVKVIYDKVNAAITGSYMLELEKVDQFFSQRRVLYQTFVEFFKALGQIIPTYFILTQPDKYLTNTFLIFALAILCLIPLQMSKTLGSKWKAIVNNW